ncbi:MAG: hypothetical protein JXR42_06395 [Gammaproteobacteria bacterium]|nr:hypothetical protein [Gammaproteobacteria bacterium]
MNNKSKKIGIYLAFILLFIGTILAIQNNLLSKKTNNKQNQLFINKNSYVVWRINDLKKYKKISNGEQSIINNIIQTAISSDDSKNILTNAGIEIIDHQQITSNLTKEETENIINKMRIGEEKNAAMEQISGKNQAKLIKIKATDQANLIISKAKSDAAIIKSKNELAASEIYNKAYQKNPNFYAFYRSMQAYKHVFNNNKTTIILNPEGAFFKYFNRDQ